MVEEIVDKEGNMGFISWLSRDEVKKQLQDYSGVPGATTEASVATKDEQNRIVDARQALIDSSKTTKLSKRLEANSENV